MRDTNRLTQFYSELTEIHKQSFPDWRFGQFMYNFLGWLQYEKRLDPFFPEEDKILKYIKEYANTHSPYYRGWK
jgi:hypothetical protein